MGLNDYGKNFAIFSTNSHFLIKIFANLQYLFIHFQIGNSDRYIDMDR